MITLGKVSNIDLYSAQSSSSLSTSKADDEYSVKNQHLAANEKVDADNQVNFSKAGLDAAKNSISADSTAYYRQFMPTYAGFSADNIAAGVENPSLETFSEGKDAVQVAMDARASLDKNYEKLYAIGKPFSLGNIRSVDANSLFGELDRRALYLVSSNKDGLFSKDEQNMARDKMSQQQGLAMGLYNGPSSEKSKFVDPYLGDNVEKFKAGIQFLDKVGNEEKATSIEFALQRASLQNAYENGARKQGITAEDFSTDHPLVLLILAARNAVNGDLSGGFSEGLITTAQRLQEQSWFDDYKDQLAQALQESEELYS